jgi:cell division protein FtsL
MTRLNLVLLMVLLGSCIYLVQTAYEARQLFNELDLAQNQTRQLELEYARLQTDKQSQATPLRVERVAREKLKMQVASPAVTEYIHQTAGVAP